MRPPTRTQSTQLHRFSDPRVTQSAYIEQPDRNDTLYHAIWAINRGGDVADRARGMRAVPGGRPIRRVGVVAAVRGVPRATGGAKREGWGGQASAVRVCKRMGGNLRDSGSTMRKILGARGLEPIQNSECGIRSAECGVRNAE